MASVVIFGATGLVGSSLLPLLDSEPKVSEIITYGRREPIYRSPKMRFVHGEYRQLQDELKASQVRHCFIALGTTIRKAGSQEAFRDVDFHMVLAAAKWAKAQGVETVAAVSSVGADSDSIAFYPRVKGEVEEAMIELDLPKLLILRPGLLLGDREEFRFGELLASPLMKVVNPLLIGKTARYRAIDAKDVASAMLRLSLDDTIREKVSIVEGTRFYH